MTTLRFTFAFCCCLLVACGAPETKKNESKDTLLGAPPTAKDDPFFFVAMPAAAERAEAQGTIGTANAEKETPNPPTVDGPGIRCFSCVRICAKETDCDGDEDLICGWGSHPVREVAMTRATAECDGALNLARYAPQWSKIEGDCPIAVCQ